MTATSFRPRPSYATTNGGDESHSQYASAHSYLQDTTQGEEEEEGETEESMFTAPSTHSATRYYYEDRGRGGVDKGYLEDSSVEILSTVNTPKRPPFISNPSSASTVSTTSTSSGSEVDFSGPLKSPFFVPPRSQSRPLPPTSSPSSKENRNSFLAPTRRPTSPLPPLPPAGSSSSTIRHLRGPSNTTTTTNPNAPYRAPPLTSHNSLASFQASHSENRPTTSEDSHRTSSDVDLDLSFDYDGRKEVEGSRIYEDEEYSASSSGSSASSGKGRSSQEGESAGGGSLERLEQEVMTGGWVGIEMTGLKAQDQPERDGNGKVGAAKAGREMDLRAQFKAAEELEKGQVQQREQDVSVVVMREFDHSAQLREEEEEQRRKEIRAGKRPVEGIRLTREEKSTRIQRRRSAGFGFAYNTTESLNAPIARQAPHSAPLASEPVFANQQQQKPAHQVVDLSPFSAELDQAKRTKAFPLPLRLNPKRSSLTATTNSASSPQAKLGSMFGAKGSRQSLVYYDSDVASPEPSPLFDNYHTEDEGGGGGGGGTATNRTAPSTPNDTPLFQECFSDEETTPPPVPDKGQGGSLAGLGFDFDISDTSPSISRETREEFPVVPLRRRSLPPPPAPSTLTTRRVSTTRHVPIPSLSISPPQRTQDHYPLEDILETDSSRSSQDSSIDPTVSPSRRISRRLSSSNPGLAGIGSSGISRRQSFGIGQQQTSTPTNDRVGGGGATIITPQHLLVTPSDADQSAPSFSFSPAPLRLVKAQLLRAAGYRYDHVPTSSPPLGSNPSLDSIQHATSSPRKKPATPQPPELIQQHQQSPLSSRSSSSEKVVGAVRRKNRVETTLEELSDLLSSSAETWIDEAIPAKLAFIAGFLLGPWCWIIGGWYLRAQDGELPNSRGTRCRTLTCNCGRILRGSTSRQQAQHTTNSGRGKKERSEDDWAGLDKWVFGNRVAACGGGVGIAVLVGVAIWAAASA
ncbi:hypothetical protein JCM5350_001930 [Sporobolomyces pararoseus]